MKILFMCVYNSARSQLAEGLARSIMPDAEIQSAGSTPAGVNPYAIRVLKEIGIDISKHYSKSVDQLSPGFLSTLNYVITLCAEEVCPVTVSKAKRLHWPHPDPGHAAPSEGEQLKSFREARDRIRTEIEDFALRIQT